MKREQGKNEVSKGSYGKRPDGTEKGRGWLGELKLPNGGVATEYSVGVNFDGKETLIPTLVPTLTKEQVATMVNDVIPNRKAVPEDILRSAALHAKERIAKGESVWAPTNAVKEVRQSAAGGDAGDNLQEPDVPVNSEPAADTDVNNGPRIAVNPEVFNDKRDALCVAFNEAYRVVMEMNGFDPVSEPTDKQREFFADTAYADDETMLRRTILARICTFDTSVGDPTDEQLEEAVEFLDTVMEIGVPQNRWEQSVVQRTRDILEKSIGMPREEKEPQNPAPSNGQTNEAAGGGEAEDPLKDMFSEEDKAASSDLDKALSEYGKTSAPQADQGAMPAEDPAMKAEREGAEKAAEIAKGMQAAAERGPVDDTTYSAIKEKVEADAGQAATAVEPARPSDPFEAAHARFLDRQAQAMEKDPNMYSKQARDGNAAERADMKAAPQQTDAEPAAGPDEDAIVEDDFAAMKRLGLERAMFEKPDGSQPSAPGEASVSDPSFQQQKVAEAARRAADDEQD